MYKKSTFQTTVLGSPLPLHFENVDHKILSNSRDLTLGLVGYVTHARYS